MGFSTALAEALVVPYTTYDSVRTLAVMPLGGEAAENLRIDFGGERVPEPTEMSRSEVVHRVLAVPGAVVSCLQDPNESGLGPAPLHGLVP